MTPTEKIADNNNFICYLQKEIEKLRKVIDRIDEYDRVTSINREIWLNRRVIHNLNEDNKKLAIL